MNVHVTPRIRVRPRDNGGWELVSGGEVGADIQTIEGAIWKRDDDYYTDVSGNALDPPELRYDRNEIGSYRTLQNAEFSVDEHKLSPPGEPILCCAPNADTGDCNDLPRHGSERLDLIELQLQEPTSRGSLAKVLE